MIEKVEDSLISEIKSEVLERMMKPLFESFHKKEIFESQTFLCKHEWGCEEESDSDNPFYFCSKCGLIDHLK